MSKTTTIEDALKDAIKDLYSAESQLIAALPKMAKAASSSALRKAFTEHLAQTREHAARLNRAAEMLGMKPGNKVCKAMKGLIEEGKEILDLGEESSVIDAMLIGAAQRVEHYEIAAYGTTRAMAEALGHKDLARLLQSTLDEEGDADRLLTIIAEGEVLDGAVDMGLAAESGRSARREPDPAVSGRRA